MIRYVIAFVSVVLAFPAWAEINVKEVTSPGGIKAWLVEEPSIPFVAVELRFRGGTSLDAQGKRGATNLMVGLLEEGAGDLDAQGFARESEELAAQFGYDSHADAVSISARFLTENRDEALALLRRSLVEPSFSEVAVERVRGQVLSGLRSSLKDPDKIAGKRMSELTYGAHPYATAGEGTIDSVTALTRDDIVAAHQGALTKDRLYVGVVGDITAEELGPMLDQLLGALPETGATLPGEADVVFAGGIDVVDFDTPQSVAVFAQPGIHRNDEDFFPAYVLNVVLGGGGFESRLMTEVRQKRGLTYGVYSYLVLRDQANVYMGSVSSANDRVAEAIDVIREEWAKMADTGATSDEVEKAKALLTGAYPLRFDGNGSIARIMVGMQMDGMPIDYIVNRNDLVNAVTVEDVNRVAKELLDPELLTFVVVGKPDGV
ncbi:Peptidase M16 inactive domain protein [Shimia sp. SK013]|uniref:M16 family metallopeptidase n=1 Tax=Shimia sp. SK013 TaxID=1389006 RepID=UPI0006B68A23|nr:pitrilysin family protein [Shimia sp. SK013]KPA20510.1 Peptidase M16 inactive domain protein [Shimia sp. SK013]